MADTMYRGTPYHLWNPYTDVDDFSALIGAGPTVITRGDGPYVFDAQGQRYIDGASSLWNVAVGHGRKELAEVVARQMSELAYGPCFRQVHPRAIELASKLIEVTSHKYDRVFLGSTGSEAVETAIKMARQYHKQSPRSRDAGRYKIISLRGSYHGVSYGALSTSGVEVDNAKFGPLLPGFLQIEPPYCYRCPYGQRYPDCGLPCATALEQIIQSESPDTIAAFILEPVLGVFGMVAPPSGYYDVVGETCKKYGVILIADEVSTGFGRTGRLFASEEWAYTPDILCLGKGISSGYLPLSATLATGAIYEHFRGEDRYFEHGCSASGHPVCAAVGLANIDIIVGERLAENARHTGELLRSRLLALQEERELIGDVRGRGLMVGVELVKDRRTKEPVGDREMWERTADMAALGMVVWHMRNALGLLPPLTIDTSTAESMVKVLDKALDTGKHASIARKGRLMRLMKPAIAHNLY